MNSPSTLYMTFFTRTPSSTMDEFTQTPWIPTERELLYTSILLIHPTWLPIGLLPIHLEWIQADSFGIFKTNSDIESTKRSNLRAAQHAIPMAFMLDEWEVHSYTILPSLFLESQAGWRAFIHRTHAYSAIQNFILSGRHAPKSYNCGIWKFRGVFWYSSHFANVGW